MLNIACVACLEPGISVHTETFVRAVELFRALHKAEDIQISFYDDKADRDVASDISKKIVADNMQCVVGHFLSDAAAAAAPVYAQANIPLLLPAATQAALTRNATTFRVCDPETAYAEWLKAVLVSHNRSIGHFNRDESSHAISLSEELTSIGSSVSGSATALSLYVGKYQNAIAYLLDELKHHGRLQPTLLTDDAYSPQLLIDLKNAGLDFNNSEVWIAALQPEAVGPESVEVLSRYQKDFGQLPGTYFWETFAALQIAASEAFYTARNPSFETVLGAVSFNSHREAHPSSFKLLRCDEGAFTELIVGPKHADVALAKDFRRVLSAKKLMTRSLSEKPLDYGRCAAESWVANYAGKQLSTVSEEILDAYIRRYSREGINNKRTLIYLHGGGLVYYSLASFAPLMSYFAERLGVNVVALDYDKLPEADIVSVIGKLLKKVDCYTSGSKENLIIGDSIGGLLSLFAATRVFPDRFNYVGLIYPVLDLYREFTSYQSYGKDLLLDANTMRWFRSMARPYFQSKKFNPFQLSASELEGVKHIGVYIAGKDVLRDESEYFVQTSTKKITHICFDDLPHDFCLYRGKLNSAQQAVSRIVDHINTLSQGTRNANRPTESLST